MRAAERPHTGKLGHVTRYRYFKQFNKVDRKRRGWGLGDKGHMEIPEDGFVRCSHEDHPPSKGL